jgi:hypothetical protein
MSLRDALRDPVVHPKKIVKQLIEVTGNYTCELQRGNN